MANGWRVTGQRGTDDVVNGRFVRVMLIDVVTDDGTSTQFRVPEAQYTAVNVEATVNAWYEHQQAVAQL